MDVIGIASNGDVRTRLSLQILPMIVDWRDATSVAGSFNQERQTRSDFGGWKARLSVAPKSMAKIYTKKAKENPSDGCMPCISPHHQPANDE